ncbi:hypothetical protein B0H11DRAFT_2254124 [Mycena galericulata]|nr:hypothetical protein B0H11DRAFT_2254124 [Mycena galericulata]
MPASLSEIDAKMSDAESEKDELADDPDAHRTTDDYDDDKPSKDDEGLDENKACEACDDDKASDNGEASDDSMDGELGRCEYCSLPLGHNTRKPSRVFRCRECECELQCKKCCHSIHVCKPNHHLETGLVSKYATCCGVCKIVLAPEARRIPWWALLCEECGCGVMCQRCCFKKHEKHPLHVVKASLYAPSTV